LRNSMAHTDPNMIKAYKKYNAYPKGQARTKKYKTSPKGKALIRKLESSPKGKARRKKYNATPKAKARTKKFQSSLKYKRWYKKRKPMMKKHYSSPEYKLSKKNRRQRNLDSWKEILPREALCGICGKAIFFRHEDRKLPRINFDHQNGGNEVIKGSPARWLMNHLATPKNIAIWESCDFGILCNECNKQTPTKDRKQWATNVVKYISKGTAKIVWVVG